MRYFFCLLIIISFAKNSFAITANYDNFKELEKVEYLFLMDQNTGEILLEKNADKRIAPSSMTKLMTAYVVFKEVKAGSIQLKNQCLIGKDAWRKRGSTMFLNYHDVVSIDDLVTGLISVSGNDSAVALAQSVSGSIPAFAKLMNKTARDIGLKNSNFKNPHGLNQDGHYMSVRDLAILTRRIARDFPQHMHYFSKKKFTYGDITQYNRNPLIKYRYEGATGMKTGYTNDGGYGVVGTATRENQSLIGVVNHLKTSTKRTRAIIALLNHGFNNFKNITIFNKNEEVSRANIWLGEKDQVEMVSKEDVLITVENDQTIGDIEFEVKYNDPIFTPIKKGQEIGTLIIKQSKKSQKIPLYAKETVKKAGYLQRMWQVMNYKFAKFGE